MAFLLRCYASLHGWEQYYEKGTIAIERVLGGAFSTFQRLCRKIFQQAAGMLVLAHGGRQAFHILMVLSELAEASVFPSGA